MEGQGLVWLIIDALRSGQDSLERRRRPSGFSEKALTAYLAESLAQGQFQDSLARVRGARDKWTDNLSYLSAPYFGGLAPKMTALQVADQAEAKRLAQIVSENSPSIFEKDGLLSFLIDRGPPSLAQGAFQYFAGSRPCQAHDQAGGWLPGAPWMRNRC